MRRCVSLLFVLALLSACGADGVSGSSRAESTEVTVTRVVDGDTVEVSPAIEGEEDVRLIGVDTPETSSSPDGAQPYGKRASRFTERALEGERVTLRFGEEKRDDYGRILAYVYSRDGDMFNETLLQRGYAQVATFPPNVRHVERFERAQREARESQRGIWGLPDRRLCRLTNRGNGIGGGCSG